MTQRAVKHLNDRKLQGAGEQHMSTEGFSEELRLYPGDEILVPEKFITNLKKYIPYSKFALENLAHAPYREGAP
jgi:hypothetical protein